MALNEIVLVTGGSGFLGSHCLLAALQKGYRIRTTLRSLSRTDEVKQMLVHGGATQDQVDALECAVADLTKDDGWASACEGCSYVLHTASPFPSSSPKDENELIVPAKEGTLRVLRAAKQAGVRRVVITSSAAAIEYGHPAREAPFTETDWSDLNNPHYPVQPYMKSKTMAESAAWKWIKEEGGSMELSVVNPVAVLGPVLGKDYSTSIAIVIRLLNGSMPGCPQVSFGAVDVRDCASLHLLAMTHPEAAGQRYLSCSDEQSNSIKDFAEMLKSGLPATQTKKVPARVLPNFLIQLVALFDPSAALIKSELGRTKKISNAKAKRELGWSPRSAKESVLASAHSVMEFGLL